LTSNWCNMKMGSNKKTIGMMVVCSGLLIAFYAFFYQPQSKRLGKLQNELKTITNSLKESEAKTSMVSSVKKRGKELEKEFISLQEKVPEEENLPEVIQSLVNESKRLGITIVAIEPVGKSEKIGSKLRRFPVEIDIESPYQLLTSYLKSIEELPITFTIDDLVIEKKENLLPSLKIHLLMSSYALAKE